MAQGEFTKAECDHARECVETMLERVPKSKRADLIGEANDLFLFLAAAKKVAPDNPPEPSDPKPKLGKNLRDAA